MNSESTTPDSALCGECGSAYRQGTSEMSALCPECANVLYGCEPCEHELVERACTKCGWDGSVSDFVRKLKAKSESDSNQ